MVNRLVSVDDAGNLPADVQEQLVGGVRDEFQAYTDEATLAANTATSAATLADTARDEAVAAAESVTVPTDAQVAALVNDEDSATRIALDTAFGEDPAAAVVVPVRYTGTVWPGRPAVRETDIVMWIGNPGGVGPAGMLTGDIWTQEDLDPGGVWVPSSATLTAATNPTLGTGGVSIGRYTRTGNTVTFRFQIIFGTTGAAAGSGTYQIMAPVGTANTTLGNTMPVGQFLLLDYSSSNRVWGVMTTNTTGTGFTMRVSPTGTPGAASIVGAAIPWTWAASDVIEGSVTYEVA